MCLGAVKTFGYPEFFVPGHHLGRPLREGSLVRPDERRDLLYRLGLRLCIALSIGTGNVTRIVAWQVEHEAIDPLGMEHSWRLAKAFVHSEVEAVRAADALAGRS